MKITKGLIAVVILAVVICFSPLQAQVVKSTPGKILVNTNIGQPSVAVNNRSDGKVSNLYLYQERFDEFSKMARAAGHVVEKVWLHHITDADLAGYDVLVMPIPYFSLTPEDIAALRKFISNGGGVFLLANSGDTVAPLANESLRRTNAPISSYVNLANLELFTSIYGIRFGESSRFAFTGNGDQLVPNISLISDIADVDQSGPLAGPLMAKKFYLPFGYAALLLDGAKAKASATLSNNGRIMVAYCSDSALLGKGRLVVCGNSYCLFDDFFRSGDNPAFLRNVIEYLLSETSNPDFAVTALSVKAKKTYPGDTITVNTTVKNLGSGAAPATNVTISLYTYDAATNTAGTLVKKIKRVSIGALAAGAQTALSSSPKIPGITDPGDYVIVVKVDPTGATKDTNTANNTRVSGKITIH